MKGFVEDVKEREYNGKKVYTATIDGKDVSFWTDSRILNYKGKEVEYTAEQKGQYTNGRLIVPGEEKKGGFAPRGKSPEEISATTKTMCMAYAKDLTVARAASYDTADKMISDCLAFYSSMYQAVSRKQEG
jgi:hypothetical protein